MNSDERPAFLYEHFEVPQGMPGRRVDGSSYTDDLYKAVRRKLHTAEDKEAWYKKYRAALRKKTARRYHQQGGYCFFCHNKCYLQSDNPQGMSNKRFATADHVIPTSAGGTDHLSNIVMACSACNSLRGNMKFSKFIFLRRDPQLWHDHCKALQKSIAYRRSARSDKRSHKGPELALKIAVMLIVKPEWLSLVQEVQAEFVRRRMVVDAAIARKKANQLVDESDLIG